MDKLLCPDPSKRLGSRDINEIKCHQFFAGIDWETLTLTQPPFVPKPLTPSDTQYFDGNPKDSSDPTNEKSDALVESTDAAASAFDRFSYTNALQLGAMTRKLIEET